MNNISNGLSIDSLLTPTNQDIIITFTPQDDVTSYKYRILKNSSENLTTMNGALEMPNTIYNDYVEINSKEPTNISLTETGVFQIEIITTNINQLFRFTK